MGFDDVTRRHQLCYALMLYVDRRVYIAVMISITGGAFPFAHL